MFGKKQCHNRHEIVRLMFQNDFLYDEIGNEPFTEVILVVQKWRLRSFNDI